jgi:hypothetical protein
MGTADVLNISISVSGAGPQREGFGEPLVATYHTHYTDRVREYSSTADMLTDGFLVTDPGYLAVANVFAQNPAPPFVKVGRRALPFTQVTKLQLLSSSATDTYVFYFRSPGGSFQQVSVPSTGVPNTDVATVNTAVTALSIPHLTATHATDTLTLTMAAGFLLDVKPGPVALAKFSDTTTDPGIATDLVAIAAADSDWYGLLLDSNSALEIAAAAVWAESNGKLFVWNNSDSACIDPSSTTDIFYTEKQLAHARDAGIFSYTATLSYAAAAWMGRLFPTDPGTENWAFKTLSNVIVDKMTDGQIHAIENKNGTVYTSLKGLSLTQFGKQPSGEWIDVTRGVDALKDDMVVGVIALEANSLRVPYTDAGRDQFVNVISASLKRFTDSGFLSENPAFTVTAPLVKNVDSTNKKARNLPNVKFAATIAGAINSANVQGTLTE